VPSCAPVARRAAIASASDLPAATVVASVDDPARPRANAFALGDAAAFDRCLAQRALVRSGAFALHVHRPSSSAVDAPPAWRLGLVIPKRFESSAVARNTIKRRWRAAFRRGRADWAAEFGTADVVVRMQASLARRDEPLAAAPARVRARSAFDPQGLLGLLTAKLRTGASDSRRRADGARAVAS
jgi:ribonuclease P protein component